MHSRTFSTFLPVAVCALVLSATAAQAQTGWVPIKLNTGGHDLNTVYFIDSKRGWVGGDGGFLSRTDDGGQTWLRQNVATTPAINDIYFCHQRPEKRRGGEEGRT